MLRAVIKLAFVVEANSLIKELNKVMSVIQYLKQNLYAPIKRKWIQRQMRLSQQKLRHDVRFCYVKPVVSIVIPRQEYKNLNFPGVDWAIIIYFVTV